MTWKWWILIAALIVVLLAVAWVLISSYALASWKPLVKDSAALSAILEKDSDQYRQPAVAGALIYENDVIVTASAGSTRAGGTEKLTPQSRFHIGSVAKSFTALLIAILVSEKKLSWDMPLEKALPGIRMLDDYRKVTIRQLLLNQAGILPFQDEAAETPAVKDFLWKKLPADYPNPLEQRKGMAEYALAQPPLFQPGKKIVYSNVGWAIAGLIAELAGQKPYEQMVGEKIFEPLGMKNARIGGWPVTGKEPGQVWGHYPAAEAGNWPVPQPQDDPYLFPAWMNPAGGIHCTIEDFALYTRENLLGLQNKGKLLKAQHYRQLHSVQGVARLGEMYVNFDEIRKMNPAADRKQALPLGYGWLVVPVDLFNTMSFAEGSGGTFLAMAVVSPGMRAAFCGFTSCGSGTAALNEVIEKVSGMKLQ